MSLPTLWDMANGVNQRQLLCQIISALLIVFCFQLFFFLEIIEVIEIVDCYWILLPIALISICFVICFCAVKLSTI